MHIETVTISNYKSFLEKQTLHLEPGFNLLLGANNAGKTTVFEVIDMDVGLNEPHRSERTIPKHGGVTLQPSAFEVTLATRFSELSGLLSASQIYLPLTLPAGSVTSAYISDHVLAFVKKDDPFRITSIFGNGLEKIGRAHV